MRYLSILLALALASPAAAQTLIVGNKGEDSVSFVDLKTGAVRAKVATASMPHEVAVSQPSILFDPQHQFTGGLTRFHTAMRFAGRGER